MIYELADINTWANLSLHLAEKLRGAVAQRTYRLSRGEENKQAAVEHLERALAYWDVVNAITHPIYKYMRLANYNHNFFEANGGNWVHWSLMRDEVFTETDIARQDVASGVH